MKEKDLKYLFIKSIYSDHVCGFDLFSSKDPSITIKIKDEVYFRGFDLVVAIIQNRPSSIIQLDSIDSYENYLNILLRTGQLSQFAHREKCRIDLIKFFPVELKSDDDVIDERLPNQILNAILTFGRAILVLDKKHGDRAKDRRYGYLIPATIISYTGREDYFEVISVFKRFIATSVLELDSRKLAGLLLEYGIERHSGVYRCLQKIQCIYQKLIFNQLLGHEPVFDSEELSFLQKLAELKPPQERKELKQLIELTQNFKITDYIRKCDSKLV
jgi:hypothetical protein